MKPIPMKENLIALRKKCFFVHKCIYDKQLNGPVVVTFLEGKREDELRQENFAKYAGESIT